MDNWETILRYKKIESLAFKLLELVDVSEPVERSVRLSGFKYSPNDVVAALEADEADDGDLEAILVVLGLCTEDTYRDMLVKAADKLILRIKRGY
jgi:hypothetical protein